MRIIVPPFSKILFFIIVNLVLLNPLAGQSDAIVRAGSFKSYKKTTNGVFLTATNTKVDIQVYSATILRIRYIKNGTNEDPLTYPITLNPSGTLALVREDKDQVTFRTDSLQLVVWKSPLKLEFRNAGGKTLQRDHDFGVNWQGTQVTNYKYLFPDEKFIGLGEKTGHLDKRGSAYENWNTDDFAYELEADPLYKSIPFYMGLHDSLTYGIYLNNSSRTKFSFAASTDNTMVHYGADYGDLDYFFFSASSVARIIEDYTSLTGRMPMPPLWSLGYQQCRWSYYPDSKVMDIATNFRTRKIPADVIYLDIHYMDEYKVFTFHPQWFSKPRQLIDSLKSLGFKTVVIIDPGVKVENGYKAYESLKENGYYAKYPDGTPYIGSVWPGRCLFPDFTNPLGRAWWGQQFKPLVDMGIDGFWNDMNEIATWGQFIPNMVQFDMDGQKASYLKAKNLYGMQMTRATYEGTLPLLKKRPLVLTRATFSGGQRYSAVWTGDNFASDDHMLLGVRLINGLGLSGFPFAGMDIAGFDGEPTPALFARWLSIGVFSPFFRGHAKHGTMQHEPWSFGEEIEAISRNLINFRYVLMPYIYSSFYQAAQTGMPVARSLAIDYTFDPRVFNYDKEHQYLFGPNILVAPAKSTDRYESVYLPKGEWYHLYSDKKYTGNSDIVVSAPLTELPVFVKAGSIIPQQSLVQNTSENTDGILYLHLYAGDEKGTFTYYEDDGVSFDDQKNIYCKREIILDTRGHKLTLGQQSGTYVSRFKKIRLIFHGFGVMESRLIKTRVENNLPVYDTGWEKDKIEVTW